MKAHLVDDPGEGEWGGVFPDCGQPVNPDFHGLDWILGDERHPLLCGGELPVDIELQFLARGENSGKVGPLADDGSARCHGVKFFIGSDHEPWFATVDNQRKAVGGAATGQDDPGWFLRLHPGLHGQWLACWVEGFHEWECNL